MGHSSMRRGFTAALAVAATFALAACGSDPESQATASDSGGLTPVRVMMYPAQVYRLPAIVAQDQGFFKDHGIDVEFVAQPPSLQGTQGLTATKSQVGQLSTTTVAQGWQSGVKTAFFCGGLNVIQTSLAAQAGSKLPPITDGATWQEVLQALKGKKIGIQTPVGTGVQLLFAAALKEAGVTDVTYVNVSTDMKVASAALNNGSVDVVQVTPPVLQNLVSSDQAKELLYLPDGPDAYKNNYGSGWTAPASWLDSDPDDAKAFCDAVKDGLDFIRDSSNAKQASALLQKDTGVPANIADKVLADGVYDDFSTDIDKGQVEKTLQMYLDLGIIKPAPVIKVSDIVRQAGS